MKKTILVLLPLLVIFFKGFSEAKPNILFIFADDHCYKALSAFGSEVKTPNLDTLVKNGTSFSNAYNMGAWQPAVCMASRQMIITGRHLWSAYDVVYSMENEVKAGRLWPQMMNASGYRTYMSGKWHIRTKAEKIFDVVKDVRGGMPNQTEAGYNRPVDFNEYKTGWKPWETKYEGFWQGGRHWSEVLADHGIDFLKQAKSDSKPFFMYLAFNAPHDPRQAPKEYVDMYPIKNIEIPVNYMSENPHKEAMACTADLRDERLAPFPRTKFSIQVNRQEYYALITHMDDQIGRILDELKATSQNKNTYIIYTADHGLGVGQHGLLGKQNMFEHSLKAPFIIVGPGVEKGKVIDTPIYIQDVMPTTLELAGQKLPKEVEFKSLLPLMEKDSKSHYKKITASYTNSQHMVRKGDYKLIYYPTIDKYLLFNVKNDPDEIKDLYSIEYKTTIDLLKSEMKSYLKEINHGNFPSAQEMKARLKNSQTRSR